MKGFNNNLIVDLSFNFGLKILEYAELLERDRKYVIARQILKSGTAIGANISEAQNAESTADFLHKIKIAAKEASETRYWLLLRKKAKGFPDTESLVTECESLGKILSKIIVTTKKTYSKTTH